MDIFCIWHFHYASKEVFWPKSFLNFMHEFKSAIFQFWQNGTFEPVHEISSKIFLAKSLLLKHYEDDICKKICPRVRQIQDLGQSKYKLRLFSKRTHGISKILSNLGSCEFLARLESKIRKCLFFDGSLL